MEEADLLKERLQAITDKRRIQEDIAKKRRQIEEEKLKLQYIKKKALREQWLMDGLTQQSEEEQEAMRLQAQDEQQQSDQLKSNIHRIEKEIEDLEAQELNISANEEVVLKRLKEVEKTAEDIIKELNAEFHADVTHHAPSPLPDIPSYIQLTPAKSSPTCHPGSEEPKKATFAMEISVEHDRRTGKSQVVSTATITPETIQEKGLKVYDDGHKSVYAMNQDGGKMQSGAVGEMTPTEVDELLRQATDVPSEVQYHQPVFSAPYTGTSRPSTPRTPNKTPRQTPTPSPSPFQIAISPRNAVQSQLSHELEGQKTLCKTPSPNLIQTDSPSRVQRCGEETKQSYFHIPGQSKSDKDPLPQPCSPHFGAKTPQGLTNKNTDASSPNQAALVSVKARSEGMPAPIQPVYRAVDGHRPSPSSHISEADPDALIESSVNSNSAESFSSPNLANTLPEQLESQPVTMIFMGYENAEDEEDEDIHAELVIIGNSDDDEDQAKCVEKENNEECLSYHPEGYRSKVFQPKVGIAKVTGCRDIIEDTYTNWDDSGLHKPTFIHKPGKHSPYLQGRGMDESTNTGSINMEKMKLCSTGR
ncbi:palmdelphin-like isoform X1 [Thunnus thynnus]|uniref:palmdelphin-like isoform X1 n=2 Tax=Thunnus thynnus TaxID=8237 RepID=UPI003527816A